mgnify:FL=1
MVYGMFRNKRGKKHESKEQYQSEAQKSNNMDECKKCDRKHGKQECPAHGKVCFK